MRIRRNGISKTPKTDLLELEEIGVCLSQPGGHVQGPDGGTVKGGKDYSMVSISDWSKEIMACKSPLNFHCVWVWGVGWE